MPTRELPVINGPEIVQALVDEIDWLWARQYNWSMGDGRYVARGTRRGEPRRTRRMYLHREIMGLKHAPPSEGLVDHINGDPLDNRRENLRIVTYAQNAHNRKDREGGTSRYRGVSWWADKRRPHLPGKWRAAVMVNGKLNFLGFFDDEDEAGRVTAAFYAEHMPYYRQG